MCKINGSVNRALVTALALLFSVASHGVANSSGAVSVAVGPYSDHGDALYATEPLLGVAEVEVALPEAYLRDPLKLSSGVIDAWLQAPNAILESYPLGGAAMVSYVRLLTGSDSRVVAALIDVAKNSAVTNLQIDAIGTGFARASQRGQAVAPDYVAYIQRMVAESGSVLLINAYAKALSEPETSELAPGLGQNGGGAAVSPGTLNGAGGVGPSGTVGTAGTVATSSGSFSVNGGSVSGTGDGTSIVRSASPTGS